MFPSVLRLIRLAGKCRAMIIKRERVCMVQQGARFVSIKPRAGRVSYMRRMEQAGSVLELRQIFDEIDVLQKGHVVCAFLSFQKVFLCKSTRTLTDLPRELSEEQLFLERLYFHSVPSLDPVLPFLALRKFFKCECAFNALGNVSLGVMKKVNQKIVYAELSSQLLKVAAAFILSDGIVSTWAGPMRAQFVVAFSEACYGDMLFYRKLLSASGDVLTEWTECCRLFTAKQTSVQTVLLSELLLLCEKVLATGYSPTAVETVQLLDRAGQPVKELTVTLLSSYCKGDTKKTFPVLLSLLHMVCKHNCQWEASSKEARVIKDVMNCCSEQVKHVSDTEWPSVIGCMHGIFKSISLVSFLLWIKDVIVIPLLRVGESDLCRLSVQLNWSVLGKLTYLFYQAGLDNSSVLKSVAKRIHVDHGLLYDVFGSIIILYYLANLRKLPQQSCDTVLVPLTLPSHETKFVDYFLRLSLIHAITGKFSKKLWQNALATNIAWREIAQFWRWAALLLNELAALEESPIEQLSHSAKSAVWESYPPAVPKFANDIISKNLSFVLGGSKFVASSCQLGILKADAVFVIDQSRQGVVLSGEITHRSEPFFALGLQPVLVIKPRLMSGKLSGIQCLQVQLMEAHGWHVLQVPQNYLSKGASADLKRFFQQFIEAVPLHRTEEHVYDMKSPTTQKKRHKC